MYEFHDKAASYYRQMLLRKNRKFDLIRLNVDLFIEILKICQGILRLNFPKFLYKKSTKQSNCYKESINQMECYIFTLLFTYLFYLNT